MGHLLLPRQLQFAHQALLCFHYKYESFFSFLTHSHLSSHNPLPKILTLPFQIPPTLNTLVIPSSSHIHHFSLHFLCPKIPFQ